MPWDCLLPSILFVWMGKNRFLGSVLVTSRNDDARLRLGKWKTNLAWRMFSRRAGKCARKNNSKHLVNNRQIKQWIYSQESRSNTSTVVAQDQCWIKRASCWSNGFFSWCPRIFANNIGTTKLMININFFWIRNLRITIRKHIICSALKLFLAKYTHLRNAESSKVSTFKKNACVKYMNNF